MDLNPECKLFIGGLNKNTVVATLKRHFEQWGDLVDSVVIAGPDRLSRGFGFVTYSKLDNVDKCLENGPHVIDDREVDVKRAIPKELNRGGGGGENGADSSIKTKKVFLGGLPLQITQEEIQEEMEQFGEIEEVVIIKEKMGSSPRGFGFVIFKTYEGASNACSKRHIKFKNFMDRDIEAKPARSVDEMRQASSSGRDRDRWEDDRRDRGYRSGGGGGHRGDRGSRDYPPRDGPSHRSDKYSRSPYKGGPEPYGMRAGVDYRDREPLYTSTYRAEFSSRSPGGYDSGSVGMDRYGGGDYRPPPSGAGPRAGYSYGNTGSGAYGPGPGYESGSGGFGTGSEGGYGTGSGGGYGSGSGGGYGTGSGSSYGTGSGGGYGTGSGGGYGTGSGGGYGTGSGGGYGAVSGGGYDIGGYGGYSSSMGSGPGPIKSHDRPALLPSRGSVDPGSHLGTPYGGMGGGGRFGGPRNNGGGGGGYHPYKR